MQQDEEVATAGIFSLGYLIFQVPSNLIITKVGAPTWLGLLIFCWGIVAASTAAMKTKATFYISELPCPTRPYPPLRPEPQSADMFQSGTAVYNSSSCLAFHQPPAARV